MCLVAFQKIFRKIFSGVWKRRRKTQIQKNTSHNPEKNHQRSQFEIVISSARSREGEIAINVTISPFARSRRCRSRDRDRRCDLSLSLFFRKSFEVKMRGDIHFRVKGEISGQLEIIFRKIVFSVTAKNMDFTVNDF